MEELLEEFEFYPRLPICTAHTSARIWYILLVALRTPQLRANARTYFGHNDDVHTYLVSVVPVLVYLVYTIIREWFLAQLVGTL